MRLCAHYRPVSDEITSVSFGDAGGTAVPAAVAPIEATGASDAREASGLAHRQLTSAWPLAA